MKNEKPAIRNSKQSRASLKDQQLATRIRVLTDELNERLEEARASGLVVHYFVSNSVMSVGAPKIITRVLIEEVLVSPVTRVVIEHERGMFVKKVKDAISQARC